MLGNGACLFLVNVFLGRFLDKPSFGAFSLAILALSTLAELSDFGLNAGLLRYGSYYSARGEEGKLIQLVRTVWRWRVRLAVILTVSGIALARLIAERILLVPEIAGTLAFLSSVLAAPFFSALSLPISSFASDMPRMP